MRARGDNDETTREGETESSDSETELYALEEVLLAADAYDLGR